MLYPNRVWGYTKDKEKARDSDIVGEKGSEKTKVHRMLVSALSWVSQLALTLSFLLIPVNLVFCSNNSIISTWQASTATCIVSY